MHDERLQGTVVEWVPSMFKDPDLLSDTKRIKIYKNL